MGCNCKATESILGILILVFAIWQTSVSQWVIIISAALLLIHAMKCDNCSVNVSEGVKKAKKRKRK